MYRAQVPWTINARSNHSQRLFALCNSNRIRRFYGCCNPHGRKLDAFDSESEWCIRTRRLLYGDAANVTVVS